MGSNVVQLHGAAGSRQTRDGHIAQIYIQLLPGGIIGIGVRIAASNHSDAEDRKKIAYAVACEIGDNALFILPELGHSFYESVEDLDKENISIRTLDRHLRAGDMAFVRIELPKALKKFGLENVIKATRREIERAIHFMNNKRLEVLERDLYAIILMVHE